MTDTPTKWTHSDDEENWPCNAPFFATKEEAIADGRESYDGDFRVGVANELTEEIVAEQVIRFLDWQQIEEALSEDEPPFYSDDQLLSEPSKEAEAELTVFVATWLKKHQLVSGWYSITQSELVEVEEKPV